VGNKSVTNQSVTLRILGIMRLKQQHTKLLTKYNSSLIHQHNTVFVIVDYLEHRILIRVNAELINK